MHLKEKPLVGQDLSHPKDSRATPRSRGALFDGFYVRKTEGMGFVGNRSEGKRDDKTFLELSHCLKIKEKFLRTTPNLKTWLPVGNFTYNRKLQKP